MEKAGKKPRVLISDGAPNFGVANIKKWWTQRKEGRVARLRRHQVRKRGSHNNKMERMNREIRDREKVVRGLNRAETPILKGYQLYHNFIRPQEGLNGATLAERAGICRA